MKPNFFVLERKGAELGGKKNEDKKPQRGSGKQILCAYKKLNCSKLLGR
jgi:hypothetical protein